MSVCRICEHECHHGNGGKCHCGCLNCEHDIKDALQKLEKVFRSNEGCWVWTRFWLDGTLGGNMNLVKDLMGTFERMVWLENERLD